MSKGLFEVTFRVSILPDGYSYAAQVIVLGDDDKAAQEEARKWFLSEQPFHRSDDDNLTASLDNFQTTELQSFTCYGVGDKPSRWKIPRSRVLNFK